MTMIENRIGAIGSQVQAVLRAARSQHGAEHFGRRIVDVVAIGISADKLHAVAELLVHLNRQAVIRRRGPRLVGGQQVPIEAGCVVTPERSDCSFSSVCEVEV